MKRKIDQAAEFSLKRAYSADCMHTLVQVMARKLRRKWRDDPELESALGVIYGRIHQYGLDGWRDAMLWALGGSSTEEIRKAAYEHFLSEEMEIMGYLQPSGESPNGYFSSEREEWRKEISKAFNVKDEEES